MEYDFKAIKKKLKSDLDEERYKHTKGVAHTAVSLAMRYEYDLQKAYLAGLLHDCAKCIPDEEKLALCKKYGHVLSESEKNNHALIHAGLGVYIAKDRYGIDDDEVLGAIRWHTTGRPGMTLLEKIIFTADYIEPNRTKQENLTAIRKEAFVDIDRCIYMISSDTIRFLEKRNAGIIDPYTGQVYEFYKKKIGAEE